MFLLAGARLGYPRNNVPQRGLGLAARLGTGSRGGSRGACWGRGELTLLGLNRLTHRGLLGLCGSGTGFLGVLLTLERVAKVLEAHFEVRAGAIANRIGLRRPRAACDGLVMKPGDMPSHTHDSSGDVKLRYACRNRRPT